jgi:hypothetical protein
MGADGDDDGCGAPDLLMRGTRKETAGSVFHVKNIYVGRFFYKLNHN